MDVFDNGIDFLILKNVQQEPDATWVTYEFNEGDSYTYLNLELIKVNGEYRVASYQFEK